MPDLDPRDETILDLLRTLHARLREQVVKTMETGPDPTSVARETEGDTLYAIDVDLEPTLLAFFRETFAPEIPCTLVAEGVNHDRPLVLGHSDAPDRVRVIVDPIDGTRGLMYDKRPAWILTGVAPDRGESTGLQDIRLALQTEIPTRKQNRVDQLWAVRNHSQGAIRTNLDTGDTAPLSLCPSHATGLAHGFAQIARFFNGGKDVLAALEEALLAEVVGPVEAGKARVFEDQYICNAGQLYELMAGRDRFTADIRPRLETILRTRGEFLGITAHPYDLCTWIIAAEAGVVITDGYGHPLDAPLDTTSPVSFIAYANRHLRDRIEPVFLRLMAERLG